MDTSTLVAALVLAVLVFWSVGAHNRLVALRSAISAAWAQIDEPMRRRHELLPELVALLREPLSGEHAALDAVLAARGQTLAAAAAVAHRPGDAGAAATMVLAEQVLASTMARLTALLEQHPPVQSEPAIAASLAELSVMEQRLAFRRQLYNQAAHHYNVAVRQFPTKLLTPLFRFAPAGTL